MSRDGSAGAGAGAGADAGAGAEARPERQGMPEIVIGATPADASHDAAERIAQAMRDAVAARGVAHWATTGGSTPVGIYEALASEAMRAAIPWDRVHLWWGDDRWVPPTDPLSNALACWNVLVRDVPVPVHQVHVIPVGDAMAAGAGPADAAAAYERELRAAGLEVDEAGFPRLDIVLVGIGTDGHLLSVFPGSGTWDDPHWVQAVAAPEHIAPHVARVTMHPRVVSAARLPMAVVHGAAKATIVGRLFASPRDERALPAQLAIREGAVWTLDAAAAAELPTERPAERPADLPAELPGAVTARRPTTGP